jgi:hypothetical protein
MTAIVRRRPRARWSSCQVVTTALHCPLISLHDAPRHSPLVRRVVRNKGSTKMSSFSKKLLMLGLTRGKARQTEARDSDDVPLDCTRTGYVGSTELERSYRQRQVCPPGGGKAAAHRTGPVGPHRMRLHRHWDADPEPVLRANRDGLVRACQPGGTRGLDTVHQASVTPPEPPGPWPSRRFPRPAL